MDSAIWLIILAIFVYTIIGFHLAYKETDSLKKEIKSLKHKLQVYQGEIK